MEEGGHADVRLGELTGRGDRRTAAHTVRRSSAIETGADDMEDEKHGDFAEGQGEGHDHDG